MDRETDSAVFDDGEMGPDLVSRLGHPLIEPPADPVSQLGDVWQLGRHRVVCGDCTDARAVAMALANGGGKTGVNLMVTDPPIAGVAHVSGVGGVGGGRDFLPDVMISLPRCEKKSDPTKDPEFQGMIRHFLKTKPQPFTPKAKKKPSPGKVRGKSAKT